MTAHIGAVYSDKESRMSKRLAVVALILGFLPHPVFADSLQDDIPPLATISARDVPSQPPTSAKSSAFKTGTIKMWTGIGAMALGAIVAAGSSTTATSTVPAAGITASSTIR